MSKVDKKRHAELSERVDDLTIKPGRDYVRTILNYCKEYLEWDW